MSTPSLRPVAGTAVRSPRPFIVWFEPDPNSERVHIGDSMMVRLDLSRVPRGELRELARRGFRDLVRQRTLRFEATKDVLMAHTVITLLIHRIERGEED